MGVPDFQKLQSNTAVYFSPQLSIKACTSLFDKYVKNCTWRQDPGILWIFLKFLKKLRYATGYRLMYSRIGSFCKKNHMCGTKVLCYHVEW